MNPKLRICQLRSLPCHPLCKALRTSFGSGVPTIAAYQSPCDWAILAARLPPRNRRLRASAGKCGESTIWEPQASQKPTGDSAPGRKSPPSSDPMNDRCAVGKKSADCRSTASPEEGEGKFLRTLPNSRLGWRLPETPSRRCRSTTTQPRSLRKQRGLNSQT